MMEATITTTNTTASNNNANDNDCPRFRPFVSPGQRLIKVKKAKYSTSLDPRGYIPVYEYLVNGQPIMWDRESGYVHFTGIWKALGNSKADIVKMVDSNPELKVKKIRGGFLKIQGTWIPYEYAYILCKRTAWIVRRDLVAMFGPRFVNDVLDPSHSDYGCLLLDPSQKGSSLRRNSFTTTMRQPSAAVAAAAAVGNHPYKRVHPFKRDFMRSSRNNPNKAPVILPRHNDNNNHRKEKAVSSMSLSRLLNSNNQHHQPSSDKNSSCCSDDGEDDHTIYSLKNKAFTTDSPTTTPSPTFRVIPTFDHHLGGDIHDQQWKDTTNTSKSLLLPIYTETNDEYSNVRHDTELVKVEPRITPVYSPTWSPVSPVSSESSSSTTAENGCAKDIIDTINATILLQRLSQDDGARPFKPMHPNYIPSKVMVGNQEFRICWDN